MNPDSAFKYSVRKGGMIHVSLDHKLGLASPHLPSLQPEMIMIKT